MASSKDTRVLFVPYRPGAVIYKSCDGSEISRQKHAAREYHRKAKQRRQTLRQRNGLSSSSPSQSSSATLKSESPEVMSVRTASISSYQKSKSPSFPPLRERSISLPCSPRNLLGAGRIDPMNSLPISDLSPYVQEMLDFSLTYQWSVFSFVNPGSTPEDMKRHVMSRILSSATSLYAIIFAGATYHALRKPGGPVSQENLMLRLNYKTHALRNMSREIEELGPQVPNETLYTMLSLAGFGAAEKLEPPLYLESEHPLAVVYDLDFYCRLPCEWAHLRALFHLLKQRGGLPAISRPGFAVVLSLYDVLTSFQRLEQPTFPLPKSTKQILSTWPSPEGEMVPFSHAIGIGFKNLSAAPPFVKLNTIIPSLVETTLGWYKYQKAAIDAPTLRQIVMARTTILHDLLSLPDISSSVRSSDECLYELCRLGSLSYMLIFLYPLSHGNGPHEQLARRLMVMLNIGSSLELWTTDTNFMLWATVVGGIVTKGTPLRHWFVEELNNSGMKHTLVAWPPVSSILSNYLWLDMECEGEGMAVWRETWALTQS